MMRLVFHSLSRYFYNNNLIILSYQILDNIIFVSFVLAQNKTKLRKFVGNHYKKKFIRMPLLKIFYILTKEQITTTFP